MADSIHIKLPDGSDKEFPKGTTALDIAKSISPRLADAALAAKTNGDLIDLTRPLEKDSDLRILTEKDREEDAGTGAAEHPVCAGVPAPRRRLAGVQERRRLHEVPFHRAVHQAR